ncbi:hypothetical protein CR513_35160, partial [Mucuna pruriens]
MRWFSGFPPPSIGSFSNLAIAFESQFVAAKHLEVADLFDIKQTKTKTLKQYLTRFNATTAEKHVDVEEDTEERLQAEKEIPTMEKRSSLKNRPTTEVYHLHLLDIPPPTKRQLGPSQEEWCEFHQAHDHTTKECRVLKNQIEKLIHDGYLGHFVKRRDNEKRTTGKLPERDKG